MALGILAIVTIAAGGHESKGPSPFNGQPGGKAGFQVRVYGLASDGVTIPNTPTPAPTATILPTPARRSVEDIICSYSWPCGEALAVAWCESKYDPWAYNRSSGASGVYQFIPYWHNWRLRPGESWFDAEVNVRIAHELWLEQGWGPWECKPW